MVNCSTLEFLFELIASFAQSAFLALVISTVITLWLGVGSLFVSHRDSRLPVSVAGCLDVVNATALRNSIQLTTMASVPGATATTQDIFSVENHTSSSDISK